MYLGKIKNTRAMQEVTSCKYVLIISNVKLQKSQNDYQHNERIQIESTRTTMSMMTRSRKKPNCTTNLAKGYCIDMLTV